jgi:hypothetical protein
METIGEMIIDAIFNQAKLCISGNFLLINPRDYARMKKKQQQSLMIYRLKRVRQPSSQNI